MRRRPPKYQVFVSSTFSDLRHEREAVTWKLLRDFYIPAGMEVFPASTDRGWETIKRWIDDSDYYILIIGGRYGEIDSTTGLSWTRREYEYAHSKKMPILVFIREAGAITTDKIDPKPELREHLDRFRRDLKDTHLCKFWRQSEDLSNSVGESLLSHIREDEYRGNPRPGWYRGDQLGASPDTVDELARLSRENNELREQVSLLSRSERPTLTLGVRNLSSHPELTLFPVGTLWPDSRQIQVSSTTGFSSTGDQFTHWVDAHTLSVWPELHLQNDGTGVARDVLVEISAKGVQRILLQKPDFRSISTARDIQALQRARDTSERVHLVSIGDNSVLRQHVKMVYAKSEEPLLSLGFVLDRNQAWMHEDTLSIRWSIRESTGLAEDGTLAIPIIVRTQKTAIQQTTAQAIFNEIRDRNAQNRT